MATGFFVTLIGVFEYYKRQRKGKKNTNLIEKINAIQQNEG